MKQVLKIVLLLAIAVTASARDMVGSRRLRGAALEVTAESGESTETKAGTPGSIFQSQFEFAAAAGGRAAAPATLFPAPVDQVSSVAGANGRGQRRLKGKGKGKSSKGKSKGGFFDLFPDVDLLLFTGKWYEQYRAALTVVDALVDGTFCTTYDLALAVLSTTPTPYQGVGPLGPTINGVRTAQIGVANAAVPAIPPFVPDTAAQLLQTFALWQFDGINSPGKLIESTAQDPINFSTIGSWNIVLLGDSKTGLGYAWAVIARNNAAFFDETKPVQWQLITRDVNKAAFLLLYAADVREAMEDAGLYDFPDDSFNAALSTYQDISDPIPANGLCLYPA